MYTPPETILQIFFMVAAFSSLNVFHTLAKITLSTYTLPPYMIFSILFYFLHYVYYLCLLFVLLCLLCLLLSDVMCLFMDLFSIFLDSIVRSVKAGLLFTVRSQHLELCQACSSCTINISWINDIRQTIWSALIEM